MFSYLCRDWSKTMLVTEAHVHVLLGLISAYFLFAELFLKTQIYICILYHTSSPKYHRLSSRNKERPRSTYHYNDVIMGAIASQITSLTVVYSTIYSDADQRKHQSFASLAFVWGIHRDRWIPRTKVQLGGKCFHFMTSSCLAHIIPILMNRWCNDAG